jgi:hypothetical protein
VTAEIHRRQNFFVHFSKEQSTSTSRAARLMQRKRSAAEEIEGGRRFRHPRNGSQQEKEWAMTSDRRIPGISENFRFGRIVSPVHAAELQAGAALREIVSRRVSTRIGNGLARRCAGAIGRVCSSPRRVACCVFNVTQATLKSWRKLEKQWATKNCLEFHWNLLRAVL